VTRAKSLLVVVGDERALRKDDCWRAWLSHCRRVGTVLGDGMLQPSSNDDDGDAESGVETDDDIHIEELGFAVLGADEENEGAFGTVADQTWRVAL
jgi:hypothetical protein